MPDAVSDVALPPALARTSTQLTAWRFFASNNLTGAQAPSFDDSTWQAVTVPHTFDGRGLPIATYSHAWYRTHVQVTAAMKAHGRIYVDFEGAGTISDVYLNGQSLGEHRGLYTRFVFDASDAAVVGDNVLAVQTDNTDADSADCLPSTPIARDYYEPYGGIYRKAWLLTVDEVHVAPTDLASPGVYLTPTVPETGGDGTLSVRTQVRNTSAGGRAVHVVHHVDDAKGTEVATLTADVLIAAGGTLTAQASGTVTAPHRWSPADPYLYSVVTELSIDGVVRDSVTQTIGFRTFRMTPTAFFINGVNTPLRGIAKHQESEQHFTAMTDDELRADWAGMHAVGFNLVRLVHYPHAHLEYDLADSMGFVVWTENGNSTPYPFTQTGDTNTRELVRQNYDHPSIAFWAAGNETVDPSNQTTVDAAVGYAKALHEEDATRLVTYASSSLTFTDPSFDFIGENLYEGLVQGDPWGFEADAAQYHYVSENGSRATVTQHIDYAAAPTSRQPNVFEPEEYIQNTVEASAQVVFRTQTGQVPLFAWWAYRDFQLAGRMDGVCNNGLVTYDGAHPKDHYFLYQSFLLPGQPVVHLVGALDYVRRGAASNGIKVYSNAAKLDLTIDGVDMGTMADGAFTQPVTGREVDDVFYWPVTLFQGPNYVHVDDGAGHTDDMMVVFAGAGGQALPALSAAPLVTSVTSTNAQNPPYFVDRPISPDVPVYYDFDGTADNTFAALPAQLVGAGQIATLRTSKAQNLGDITVTVSATANAGKGATVLLMTTDDGTSLATWTAAGFTDTGAAGTWRDTTMTLVPFKLLSKTVAAGASVKVPGTTRDYAVLVKPAP